MLRSGVDLSRALMERVKDSVRNCAYSREARAPPTAAVIRQLRDLSADLLKAERLSHVIYGARQQSTIHTRLHVALRCFKI